MRSRYQLWTGLVSAVGLIVLIVDARTALMGAQEGIELCINTVLASLFPFFFLSVLMNSTITGVRPKIFRPLGRLCGIPAGAEGILILGLLGGYPVGAQSVAQAYKCNAIGKRDAHRMLGFCSNAGPAFIFGMLSSLFDSVSILWVLWAIHILSALAVGFMLPNRQASFAQPLLTPPITVSQALEKSVKIIAVVCGWVILFRVLLAFFGRWFLWLLPSEFKIGIIGMLELSNGCLELHAVISPGMRFIFCAGILGFGGICVAMQTLSVTKEVGTGMYFPGKLLQSCISVILAASAEHVLFSASDRSNLPAYAVIILLFLILVFVATLHRRKKALAILH